MFVDRVKIKLVSGKGGNGLTSFRREKYVPLGGPNGGDGGKGGDIIFKVDTNKSTLLDLKYNKHLTAENGQNGKSKKMHGSDGQDLIVKVPLGTVIIDEESNKVLADLTYASQEVVIVRGGRGGRGNYRFMTSRNTAPDYSEMGEPGTELNVLVELKLLADIGLVGFPSVGKSSLLSVVSNAKPEVAPYPFTTIVPNLGVVQVDNTSFVLADLPGLIEGASQGKGLGHQFLQHIERCRILIHVLDMGGEERDPLQDFEITNAELKSYNSDLLMRPMIVVANKMDLDNANINLERFKESFPEYEIFPIVTITHEGLEALLYKLKELFINLPQEIEESQINPGTIYKYEEPVARFTIVNLGNGVFEVKGEEVLRMLKMTDLSKESAILRMAHNLRKMGVDKGLRSKGAKDGDTIRIDRFEFEFVE